MPISNEFVKNCKYVKTGPSIGLGPIPIKHFTFKEA
jgi:hypothetical protein